MVRAKTSVMYKCKDRRKCPVDLPSSVGRFGGNVKGDKMQIQRLYNRIRLIDGQRQIAYAF